ncbi:hypothetical protein D3C83_62780 [compost metagenome]
MMSGPDPGALPMMSRIGLSGYDGCAAYAADNDNAVAIATAVRNFIVPMSILLSCFRVLPFRTPRHKADLVAERAV